MNTFLSLFTYLRLNGYLTSLFWKFSINFLLLISFFLYFSRILLLLKLLLAFLFNNCFFLLNSFLFYSSLGLFIHSHSQTVLLSKSCTLELVPQSTGICFLSFFYLPGETTFLWPRFFLATCHLSSLAVLTSPECLFPGMSVVDGFRRQPRRLPDLLLEQSEEVALHLGLLLVPGITCHQQMSWLISHSQIFTHTRN